MCHTILSACSAQHVNLIFHQSNQRRDNDSGARHQECRQLVAQRFATSRRHKHKYILALHERADNFFLPALEGVKTEMFLQFRFQVHVSLHGIDNRAYVSLETVA